MANIYELTESIRLLWDLMDQGKLDDDVLKDAMMNSQEDLKNGVNLEGIAHLEQNYGLRIR